MNDAFNSLASSADDLSVCYIAFNKFSFFRDAAFFSANQIVDHSNLITIGQ